MGIQNFRSNLSGISIYYPILIKLSITATILVPTILSEISFDLKNI